MYKCSISGADSKTVHTGTSSKSMKMFVPCVVSVALLATASLRLSLVDGTSCNSNPYPQPLHLSCTARGGATASTDIEPRKKHRIVGLQNLGNTCYLNAQIQCLYHIPYVRNAILRDPSHFESNDEPSPAFIGLRQLFSDMEEASLYGRAVAPSILCQLLDIPVREQQDSQEFWKLLLPALKVQKLIDLYTGTYENYIVALDGSNRERRFLETFLDLSLEMPATTTATMQNTESYSILDSLSRQFNEPELLSVATGNAWRPSPDSEKIDAHKGYRLVVPGLPSILQLHLKRFHFDWETETTSKVNNPLTFPLTLNLTSVVALGTVDACGSDKENECLYDLQAVLVHVGEYHSGHYYSYVRPDIRMKDWYRFNDEIHTKVRFTDVVRDAYGGKSRVDDIETTKMVGNESDMGNRLVRMFRRIFGFVSDSQRNDDYGYGGPKASAYVLQYIRRKDITKLYDCDSHSYMSQIT